MNVYWDAGIKMDDGVVLRADIFRPIEEGRYPAILSYGPYGKGLHFKDANAAQWDYLVSNYPEIYEGSSCKYMNLETVDPEMWVHDGYAVIRVDSRAAGRSPGFLDPLSERETEDLYNCIEWAAIQEWSNGKVGLAGISYYAVNQWTVASRNPPHLAAMCPWEGASDFYREVSHHGGLASLNFTGIWYRNSVLRVQHGVGVRGPISSMTGDYVAGPETLPEDELRRNRVDMVELIKAHPFDDEFHRKRSPDFSRINVPLLSCGNWGGMGLHLRGNTEGYALSSSEEKWLEIHGRPHWAEFYSRYGVTLMKRFFEHYLKGVNNGFEKMSRVMLWIRHPGGRYVLRNENEWPIARTEWTKLYLDSSTHTLSSRMLDMESAAEYEAMGSGLTFLSNPLPEDMEITGPASAKLFISSSTVDADIFLILRAFTPDVKEVHFFDFLDPHTPIGMGWLRASHRRLDTQKSKEWRPYHTHDRQELLTPGEIYELDVEIWPTCIALPRGFRLGLTVRGKDYEYAGVPIRVGEFTLAGSGPFLHSREAMNNYSGNVTVYSGPQYSSNVLLPVIPQKNQM